MATQSPPPPHLQDLICHAISKACTDRKLHAHERRRSTPLRNFLTSEFRSQAHNRWITKCVCGARNCAHKISLFRSEIVVENLSSKTVSQIAPVHIAPLLCLPRVRFHVICKRVAAELYGAQLVFFHVRFTGVIRVHSARDCTCASAKVIHMLDGTQPAYHNLHSTRIGQLESCQKRLAN